MTLEERIRQARITGEFIPGLATKYNRLSKSKLNGHISCPRNYWYDEILKRVVPFPPETEAIFARGRSVHKLHESFFMAANNNRSSLIRDGENFINEWFNQFPADSLLHEYVEGIREWEITKWKTYWDAGYNDILHYFLPLTMTNNEYAVEKKLYNEELDWVCIADQIFWIPPGPKSKTGKDEIMIVDDKSGKHNPNYYTGLRVELSFMKRIFDMSELLTQDITYGAIFWPLTQDIMMTKFTKRQVNTLNRRLNRLDFCYKNDVWPCKPAAEWYCSNCKHATICPMDFKTKEYRFPPGLDLDDDE
jgi:CRISPR/Cas system-associated exonuclease Cas4 (RecB family)